MECERARLEPGQVLAMFTDGLTETRVNESDLLGIDGLSEELASLCRGNPAAPLKDLGTGLKLMLDRHVGNRLPDDDRTYLLVRRC